MSCWVCDYVRDGGHSQETRDLYNDWDALNMVLLHIDHSPGRAPQDTDEVVRTMEARVLSVFRASLAEEMRAAHIAMRDHRKTCAEVECLYTGITMCNDYDLPLDAPG